MKNELRELIFNENVPINLIEEFSSKMKALSAKADELLSTLVKTRSYREKADVVRQMFRLQEKAEKTKADFIKKARKYVKKGGVSDEEK